VIFLETHPLEILFYPRIIGEYPFDMYGYSQHGIVYPLELMLYMGRIHILQGLEREL